MTIHTALIAVAKEIQNPIKTAENPHFRSKFAPLCEILTVVRPLLAKHGLVMTQATDVTEHGPVLVTTIHASDGTHITGRYPLEPSKKDPQGYAAAVTYARRYALTAMLGIAGDDDDDGNLSARQAKTDAVTGEPKKKKTELTEEQKSALGVLRADTLKYGGETADDEFKAVWKQFSYSDYQAIHGALAAVKQKYYAIAVQAGKV